MRTLAAAGLIFTARRYAKRGIAVPSVCLSVTFVHCVETAKRYLKTFHHLPFKQIK